MTNDHDTRISSDISESTSEISGITDVINSIDDFISRFQLHSAYELAKNLHNQALVLDDSKLICYCLNIFGLVEFNYGNIETAKKYYHKSHQTAKSHQLISESIHALTGSASCYSYLGNYKKALQKYNAANVIIQNNPSEIKQKSIVLNNIGLTFQAMELYDDADKHYHEALEAALAFGDSSFSGNQIIPEIYKNLAYNNIQKKNYPGAVQYLSLGRSTYMMIKDLIGLAHCDFLEACIINGRDRNWDKALDLFNKALTLLKERAPQSVYLQMLMQFGKQAYYAQQNRLSRQILEDALSIAEESNHHTIDLSVVEVLEEIYLQSGEVEKAYFMLRRRTDFLEDIYAQWKITSVSDSAEAPKDQSSADSHQLQQLKRTLKSMKMLVEIGQSIASCLDIKQIIMVLNDSLTRFMHLSSFGIALVNKTTQQLDIMVYDAHIYSEFNIPMENETSFLVNCVKGNKEVVIYNTADLGADYYQLNPKMIEVLSDSEIKSLLFCPLQISNMTIGGVTVQSSVPYNFTYVELEALRLLTSYISIAINNINKSDSLKEMNRRLESIAQVDSLTGLLNRRALAAYIPKTFNEFIDEVLPISVFMIDLDYFKQYNDYYGHQKGDDCLISVTRAITGVLNSKQIEHSTFRYGGDEFLVLIKHCDFESCKAIVSDMQEKISELNIEHAKSKISDRVTITIGASVIKKAVTDYTKAFQCADDALYTAKNNGRNNYVIQIMV